MEGEQVYTGPMLRAKLKIRVLTALALFAATALAQPPPTLSTL